MLKQGHVARALGWGSWSAAVSVGALLLPLTPTFGQEKENTKPAEVTQKSENVKETTTIATSSTPAEAKTTTATVSVTTSEKPVETDAPPPVQAAPEVGTVAPVPPVAPPLAVAPDLVGLTPAALPPAPEADDEDGKNADNDAAKRDRDFRRQMQDVQRQKASQQRVQAELQRAQRDVQMLSQRLQEATARLQKLQSQLQQQGLIAAGSAPLNLEAAPNPLTAPKEFKAYIDSQVNRAQQEMRAVTKDGKTFLFSRDAQSNGNPKTPTGVLIRPRGSDDERMDRLEKQLSELMKEVRDLRRDRGRNSDDSRPEERGR